MSVSRPPRSGICLDCLHYMESKLIPAKVIGADVTFDGLHVDVCPAFPKGIPNDIINGDHRHRIRHPDQVG